MLGPARFLEGLESRSEAAPSQEPFLQSVAPKLAHLPRLLLLSLARLVPGKVKALAPVPGPCVPLLRLDTKLT